jgi:hypothetical protein
MKVGLVWYVTRWDLIHANNVDSSRLFDLAQSVLQMQGLYNILISNYGNIENALNPIFTLDASIVAAAFVYALVQVRHGYDLH